MSRSPFALILLSVVLAGCGGDDREPGYLGPIDAGSVDDAKQPDPPPPVPTTLKRMRCEDSTPVLGPDVGRTLRSVAALASRGVLTQAGVVRAVQLDEQGCPGAPISSFGQDGSLAIEASSAVPLPGGRTLVAMDGGTVLLDSTGAEIGSCVSEEGSLIARFLQGDEEGRVVAAFSKAPISLIQIDLTSTVCESSAVGLSPGPFAIAALAMARDGGFVTVEQVSSTSPLVVARYGSDGVRLASSAAYASNSTGSASRLCSATGLVDTDSGIVVVDSTCRRAVVFDGSELVAVGEVSFEHVPRGAALTPDGRHVLVAVSQALEQGAVATFERVAL